MSETLTLDSAALTRKEVMRRLGVSKYVLQQIVKQGKLHPIRQSSRWVRFRESEVNAYVEGLLDGTPKPASE